MCHCIYAHVKICECVEAKERKKEKEKEEKEKKKRNRKTKRNIMRKREGPTEIEF